MKKKLTFLLILANHIPFLHSKLVIGDSNAAPNNTFSFTIGFTKYQDKTETSFARFWSATNDANIANMPDDTKKYGLSFTNQAASYVDPSFEIKATPMTNDEDAIIFELDDNKVISPTEPNPIWGAAFSLFDVVQKPIFVLQNQLNNLYSVYNIERYEAPATGENTTQLLRYNFGAGQEIKALKGFINGIYAAYSQGNFGSTPSNIALLERSQLQDVNNPNMGSPYLKLIGSAPVTVDTLALIGGPGKTSLSSLGTSIGIDVVASRIFFYTQAQAAVSGIAFPIAQILVAQSSQGVTSLLFSPIVPENVVNQNTVISATNSASIRITAAKSMLTSTDLQYMIVAQDAGTGPQTIYALPLVTKGLYSGMIADFSSITTKFGTLKPTFVERYFTNVLSDPSQIDPTNTAIQNQLRVGGSSTLPINSGDIKQVYVVGDSVYAVIGQEYDAHNAPGTYRSQALFSSQGYIIGWTPWARVLGSEQQMNYSFVDNKYLTGTYVAATTSSATPEFKSMYQTTFNTTSNLSEFLTAAQGSVGGIQGLFNFNQYTSGFNNSISMLISTAFNKVALAQTGYLDSGVFKIMQNPTVLGFSFNEKTKNQGPLIAAEIAHDSNNNHYIFVGGVNGVSILTNDSTGISWNGNLSSINDLNSDQITWKKLGDFSFVKKLIWDTDYIYILTSNGLFRILLDPNKFTLNPTEKLNVELVLKGTDVGTTTYFLDAIIDNGYCLLGTTSGLYRFNNNNLLKITIPGGLPAVSQITAICPNNNPAHSFKDMSNLIILNSTFGTQQSKIYRFAIENEIITMLPDTLVATPANLFQGIPSAFITFDNFISSYFTDGSWNTAQSYYVGPNQPENSVATPFVMQIQSSIHSGQSSSQVIMPMLTNMAPFPFLRLTSNILNMTRETTSGELIVAGDFEAYTNA